MRVETRNKPVTTCKATAATTTTKLPFSVVPLFRLRCEAAAFQTYQLHEQKQMNDTTTAFSPVIIPS